MITLEMIAMAAFGAVIGLLLLECKRLTEYIHHLERRVRFWHDAAVNADKGWGETLDLIKAERVATQESREPPVQILPDTTPANTEETSRQ